MCQEAYTKEKLKGKGKGCKKGGGTETRKTDTTGQKTHTRKSMEDALEQRDELERKNGGAARIAKRRRHWNRGHTQGKHGRCTRSHT